MNSKKEASDSPSVILFRASSIGITVDASVTDGEHSFTMWNQEVDEQGRRKVHLSAEETWFTHRGEKFRFDGVRYFPEHNDSIESTTVDLVFGDGAFPQPGHPMYDLSVQKFMDLIDSGKLEPISRPE